MGTVEIASVRVHLMSFQEARCAMTRFLGDLLLVAALHNSDRQYVVSTLA